MKSAFNNISSYCRKLLCFRPLKLNSLLCLLSLINVLEYCWGKCMCATIQGGGVVNWTGQEIVDVVVVKKYICIWVHIYFWHEYIHKFQDQFIYLCNYLKKKKKMTKGTWILFIYFCCLNFSIKSSVTTVCFLSCLHKAKRKKTEFIDL